MSLYSYARILKGIIIGSSGTEYSLQPDSTGAVEGSVLQYDLAQKQYKHQSLTFSGLPEPDSILLKKTDTQVLNSATGNPIIVNSIFVTWDPAPDYQNGGITLVSGGLNDEVQVTESGLYMVNYEIAFNETPLTSLNGQRLAYIATNKQVGNGFRRYARSRVAVTFTPSLFNPIDYKTELNGSALIKLEANDRISLVVAMESGTLLTPGQLTVGNDAGPTVEALYNEFSCVRIS